MFLKDKTMGMLKRKYRKERHPELDYGQGYKEFGHREKHWKDISEKNINRKGKVHALSWHVYMKDKKDSINKKVLVEVKNMKEGDCLKLCGGKYYHGK